MPLILDTFNVLHTVGVLPPELAGLDVSGLAELILRSRYAGEKVTFACDGLPAADLPPQGPLTLPGEFAADVAMQVRYSGRASTADDLIRQMIDASTAPRRVIVVSSDHEIQRHANRRRCVVLTSPEFLQHLADDANLPRPAAIEPTRRPTMMSTEQVERWKDVFKIDDEVAAALAPPAPPPPSSSPSGTKHASTPASPNATDETDIVRNTPAGAPPLPADLIAQAEELWQRESRRAPVRPPLRPPAHGDPSTTPTTSSPVGDSSTANNSQQTSAPAVGNAEVDVDLENFDMNAILPQDGRTRELRKDDSRRRPI